METPISDAAVYEIFGTDKVVDYEVCRDLEVKLIKALEEIERLEKNFL